MTKTNTNEISEGGSGELAQFFEDMPYTSWTFNADDKIQPKFLQNYQDAAKIFRNELWALLEILEIAKQLDEFDFDLFPPTTDCDKEYLSIIDRQIWLNLRNAVLIIMRLTTDREGYTLFKFKSELSNQWVKDEYKGKLERRLEDLAKQEMCECRIKEDSKKLIPLRNKWLAHIDKQTANGKFEHPKLELEELKAICEKLMRFFEVLTFDTALNTYSTQNIKYLKNRLDEVAVKSEVLHLPESNPLDWEKLKQNFSKDTEKLIKFNHYRAIAKLPCIWQLET